MLLAPGVVTRRPATTAWPTSSLAGDPLELTWRSLDQIGNLSSSSVLHVLRDTLDKRSLMPGTPGMLMAMGPGFCSELVLLQW